MVSIPRRPTPLLVAQRSAPRSREASHCAQTVMGSPLPPPFPNRSFPSCSVVKCDPLSLHILKWQVTVGLGKILGKIYKNSLSTKDSYTPWGPIFGNSASVFAKGAPPPQHAFTTLMARFLNPPSPSPHSPPQETKKKRRVSLLSSPTEGGRGDPSCRGGPSTTQEERPQ